MARHFSHEHPKDKAPGREQAVVSAATALFEQTLVHVHGQQVGAVAALQHPHQGNEANYGEVFLRDNVPVMVYLLL